MVIVFLYQQVTDFGAEFSRWDSMVVYSQSPAPTMTE